MQFKHSQHIKNFRLIQDTPLIWKPSENNTKWVNPSDSLQNKTRKKKVKINTAINDYIFGTEELLLESPLRFTSAVCASYTADVLMIKTEEIFKIMGFSDVSRHLYTYCQEVLQAFSNSLEKAMKVEQINITKNLDDLHQGKAII